MMKNKFFNTIQFLGTTVLVLFATLNLSAQKAEVQASVSRKEIKIGEQLRFTLTVKQDDKTVVSWPAIREKVGSKFDIVEAARPDTAFSDDKKLITYTQSYVLTAFDSGYQTIPSYRFTYMSGNDTMELFTDSLGITVNTVPVDTSKFFDIVGPDDAPFSIAEILPEILLGTGILIVLGIASFFIIRYFRRRRKFVPVEIPVVEPEIPAHVFALDHLNELEKQRLWQEGKVKLYYSELTDIVRQYIHRRFLIDATEMTTEEILSIVRHTNASPASLQVLGQLLRLADLVKFAKMTPGQTENEMGMSHAREFVEQTKMEAGITGDTQ